MPHLLLFAPCQKAILDVGDNSLSVIGILHGLVFQPRNEDPSNSIPANAFAPLPWGTGTVWLRTPEDEGKTFEQRIEIVTPDGSRFYSNIATQFKMPHRTHHIAINGQGFPMGTAGECKVVLSLREVGQEEWHIITEYPIEIQHDVRNEATNDQAPIQPE